MRIISFATIRDFILKHADSDVSLREWYKKTEKADWSCFADVKQTFKVFIRWIGTHKEYDNKNCSSV